MRHTLRGEKKQTFHKAAAYHVIQKQHKQSSTLQEENIYKMADQQDKTIGKSKTNQLKQSQQLANESVQVQQAVQLQQMADRHADHMLQLQKTSEEGELPVQKKSNHTGLPDQLKSGIENLSGYGMDDVKVHYNSSKPAQLQALAYAQGSDIHLGPGQEKHLPHEAWHVVQQKQGRVQPTLQMKTGVSVNDEEHLEKEADIMGKKALQGVFSQTSSMANPVSKKAVPAFQLKPVVQRALGFEFETGWKVWDTTPIKMWEENGKQGNAPEPWSLSKKELVCEGPGFKVEADEAGGGESELEFIVHPPVDASLLGEKDLFGRMTHMTVLGAKLIYAAEKSGGDIFCLAKATGKSAHAKFIVQPLPNQLEARPQVTAGISLGKISKLNKDQGKTALHPMFGKTQTAVKTYKDNVKNLSHFPPFNDTPMSAELKGLFILMGSYLSNGEQAVFYPKQIADVLLLSRTNFARLYQMIPDHEQLFFKKNPNLWVRYALIAAGLDSSEKKLPVIGKVWTDEKMSERKPVGPSREKWLTFIRLGYDLLSAAHYKEFASFYQGTKNEGTGDALESLGELGDKTEKVGPAQKDGGIFELRSSALANKTGIIPLMKWQPFTQQIMDYFVELEK